MTDQPPATAIEWPTVAVAAALYTGFGLLTLNYHALPWWIVFPLGGYLVAWHGSLQHEVIHGHPTRWRRVNEILVLPNLGLWMPFHVYREMHLAHHDTELTAPLRDPESYYVAASTWSASSPLVRAWLWIHNTCLGRVLIGPLWIPLQLLHAELTGPRPALCKAKLWGLHATGLAPALIWVVGVCDIALLHYLALFIYPGIALTLLRSYAEHRHRPSTAHRTAIVQAGPVLSLLYLNNNLHALHHARPELAWYALPKAFHECKEALLEANNNYFYGSYAEVILRFALWPKEPPYIVNPEPDLPDAAGSDFFTPVAVSGSAASPGRGGK